MAKDHPGATFDALEFAFSNRNGKTLWVMSPNKIIDVCFALLSRHAICPTSDCSNRPFNASFAQKRHVKRLNVSAQMPAIHNIIRH